LCDVHDDLLLGLTLACPILPLYCVKPPGVPKLIGAWQIFLSFIGIGMDCFACDFQIELKGNL
jgi:hypothetical protein